MLQKRIVSCPYKLDKRVNEVIYLQKSQKIISNLLIAGIAASVKVAKMMI